MKTKTNTKARRFAPAQLGCIIGGLLWTIVFVVSWLALGMSIANLFDLSVIVVSLCAGAGVGFLGFVTAFGAISAYRQQEGSTRRDE
ncbi:MAG TPA: hypothetical protein VGP82_14170 [Ktedonobacterales bacterium]|jgi:hypothetical protein|nr:hypothetical protein [Ktedonobacterales bacterium]